MKLIKMFGLAAIVAVAAMAFVGVTSASATWTVLCTSNESGSLVCATHKYENQLVHFVASDPKLLTNLGTVLCEEALLSGEALVLAKPLLIHIHELNYITCKLGSTSCTVTTTHRGLLHLLKTGVNVGELLDLAVDLGAGAKFTTVHLECGEFINCEYKGENLLGAAEGASEPGTNGKVTYTESPVEKVAGGILCPSTAKLDAVFEQLSPLKLWIKE